MLFLGNVLETRGGGGGGLACQEMRALCQEAEEGRKIIILSLCKLSPVQSQWFFFSVRALYGR